MSDVFAMGGDVLFALNIAAFPDGLKPSILSEILRGGAEKVREAGAVIAGGHTVKDNEPKYGLAVIGMADIAAIRSKSGAQPGDVLILSKALGTGVVTTALKRGVAEPDHVAAAVASMARLNKSAARAALVTGARATTDITGYSLLGHAHEMAALSHVDLQINVSGLAWLPGTLQYAAEWIFPGGMSNNMSYYTRWTTFDPSIDRETRALLFNPETSGGLLMAVPASKADALMADLSAGGDQPQRVGVVVQGDGHLNVIP